MGNLAQMTTGDMPSLYICANQNAANAQRIYLLLLKNGIILQIAGIFASLFHPSDPHHKTISAFVAALLFFISLVLTIVLKAKQYEKVWYGG